MPRNLDRLRRTEQFRRNLQHFPHAVELPWDGERLTRSYFEHCDRAALWTRERYGAAQGYFDVGGRMSEAWTRNETVFMFANPRAAMEFTLRWR